MRLDPRLNHVWRPYTQMQTEALPLKAIRTEGAEIVLESGQRLTDGIASWWTACHGYNHPHIISAMIKQLETMPHVMFGGLTHEPALCLAHRLTQLLPGSGSEEALSHVFFCDSGSVAVEIALKMAKQFWLNKGETERNKFLCFRNAYHGDTMGAMSVCDPIEGMHGHFSGFFPEQVLTDLPRNNQTITDFERLLHRHRKTLAAVIIEPLVQCAGGMKFHDAEILSVIRKVCKENDVLFIADEIATGFGRTGTMFACEQADIYPDIICIGKAMTGGTISMAAAVANNRVWTAFQSVDPKDAFMHGPTYMANPLGCAAANASIDLFEEGNWLNQVASIENQLSDSLEVCSRLPGVIDVRVKGAIGVVQVNEGSRLTELRQFFVDNSVWVRPFGDIIYLMPPFIISDEQCTALTEAVTKAVVIWNKS
ncbi:MAG: adenosylmethionine--8-amino-7-oxononanoate transaminase [Rhodospirillaceae bacterium]